MMTLGPSGVKSKFQLPNRARIFDWLLVSFVFWSYLFFFFHFQQDGPTQIPEIPEDAIYPEEDLFDVESLLDDDTFMSIAFE